MNMNMINCRRHQHRSSSTTNSRTSSLAVKVATAALIFIVATAAGKVHHLQVVEAWSSPQSTSSSSSPSSIARNQPPQQQQQPQTTEYDRRTFLGRTTAAVAAAAVGGVGVGTTPISSGIVAHAAETSSTSSSLPTNGAMAPDFELPNSRGSGQITTLNTLTKTGKWTVLYFYPGAFSSGCTLEARGFQKDLEEYRKLNAQIVGVSVDAVEKNAQFCTEEKLDFFMLSDRGGIVSKKYGSSLSIPGFGTFSNRQTYIIDPNGQLKWIFTDVESRIARHSAEVLAKLKELEDTDGASSGTKA